MKSVKGDLVLQNQQSHPLSLPSLVLTFSRCNCLQNASHTESPICSIGIEILSFYQLHIHGELLQEIWYMQASAANFHIQDGLRTCLHAFTRLDVGTTVFNHAETQPSRPDLTANA